MSPTIRAEINVYEDDEKPWGESDLHMFIESHWNDPDAAVIEIEGKRYTIIGEHLRKALRAVEAVASR